MPDTAHSHKERTHVGHPGAGTLGKQGLSWPPLIGTRPPHDMLWFRLFRNPVKLPSNGIEPRRNCPFQCVLWCRTISFCAVSALAVRCCMYMAVNTKGNSL